VTRTGAQRRPTLLDVARLAGVSRATASLVIRDAAGPSDRSRQRVRDAAEELGYRPDRAAQLLRRQHSHLIGVMFDAQEPFHADLIESIYATTEIAGYDVVLSALVPSHGQNRAFAALAASRCGAAILLGADAANLADFDKELPVIDVGRASSPTVVDAVHTDDHAGARLAVEHLVALGHTDIVHIDGGAHPGSKERRAGYRAGMRAHGLQQHVRIVRGDYTERSGSAAARSMLDADALPSAVFAGNDRCAVGLIDEFRRAGIAVPQQVSVVGYDNSRLAKLAHIDLTSVRQNTEELARRAVEFAVERITDEVPATARTVKLAPDLVVRSSSGLHMP
jgi:DNA-binding LacI/PurR family transcriptional regulator